jgi:hypothetical protein
MEASMSGPKEALRKEVAALRETVEALRRELAARPIAPPCYHGHYMPCPGWWTCGMCGSLVSGFHVCAGSPYYTTCGVPGAAGGVSTVTINAADLPYSQAMANAACANPAPSTYMIN